MGHPHPQSNDVINRLARIEGHVRAIKEMAQKGEPCADVLHQISAVQAALQKAAQVVLDDHLDHCLVETTDTEQVREMVDGLKKALASYLR